MSFALGTIALFSVALLCMSLRPRGVVVAPNPGEAVTRSLNQEERLRRALLSERRAEEGPKPTYL